MTANEVILFAHQMYSLTRAGIFVVRAARGLADSQKNECFQGVLLDITASLEQAAGFYEEEVDYELKALTDAVEPILIISIGIMGLVLALGVFLPL